MPPLYNEPLYVPPERTAELAEPVFDPVPRGGLARVQPQAPPQATIARTLMPQQRRSEADYWKQPIIGGIPRDLFMTLTGQAAQAIAPRTASGRLGGGLARMAGDVYGRRMRREEEEPERALQRKVREAQLRKLERPETVSWKSIDPITGQERTFYGRPEDRPSEVITGMPTRKARREKGIKQIEGKYYTGHYDETGKFAPRRELTKAEMAKQVTGKEVGKKPPSFFTQQNYRMISGQVADLQKLLNTPDPISGELPSGAAVSNIQKQINKNMSDMGKIQEAWQKGQAGGIDQVGGVQPIDEQAFSPIIQQAISAGIPIEQIKSYFADPNATPEGFARQFNLGREPEIRPEPTPPRPPTPPEGEEVPDVKSVPVNAGLQRQQVPFRTTMTKGPTEEQRTAAMQELSDLADTLGLGAEDWKSLGRTAKSAGSWAWNKYQNAINTVLQGQREAREQLGSTYR